MNGLSKSLGFLYLVTSVLELTFYQDGEAVVPHQPGCPKGWGKCSGYKRIFLNREKKVVQDDKRRICEAARTLNCDKK